MLVALTGATGFLGRRTLAALHRQGQAVRALSRRKEQPAALEGLSDQGVLATSTIPPCRRNWLPASKQ